jgi:hypothetical protein
LEQEFICLRAIEYYAQYHSKNFFNGNIKPDNVFVREDYLTSSVGTLLYLGNDHEIDTPRYIITQYTLGFASKEFVESV